MREKLGILICLIVIISIIVLIEINLIHSFKQAIEKYDWGDSFFTLVLDSDTKLTYLEKEKDHVKLISLRRGWLGGWKVVDSSPEILATNGNHEVIEGIEGTIDIGKGENRHYVFGVIKEKNIRGVYIIHDNLEDEFSLNVATSQKQGTRIFYGIIEEEWADITYRVYSNDGELIYEGK